MKQKMIVLHVLAAGSSNTTSDDAPWDPQLLNTAWGECECNQTMQDVAHNCQGQYNLLPMAQCADTASAPLAYTACNGSCSAASSDHYVYGPWGSCSATCGGGTQTRTGDRLLLLLILWSSLFGRPPCNCSTQWLLLSSKWQSVCIWYTRKLQCCLWWRHAD